MTSSESTDWRDDPGIIWEDAGGDRLTVFTYRDGAATVELGRYPSAMWGPRTPAGWSELLRRLAAAAGLRITGIETAPDPIKEGDEVVDRHSRRRSPLRVRAILGDHAWVHGANHPKDPGWGVHLDDLDHAKETEQ